MCKKVKSVDVAIKKSPIDTPPKVDAVYREAYFNILKGKIPTINSDGEKMYFKDLYMMGVEFDELNELSKDKHYSFYYYDLDGDGLPELGIRSYGYTYILKYELEKNEFLVLFSGATMYYTILGTGQIWYHNGLHAGYIIDQYIVLNSKKEWKTVFEFEKSAVLQEEIDDGFVPYYCIDIDQYKGVDVGEKNWNEITEPFFKATENAISSESLKEVFGELLDEN